VFNIIQLAALNVSYFLIGNLRYRQLVMMFGLGAHKSCRALLFRLDGVKDKCPNDVVLSKKIKINISLIVIF